VDKGAELYRQFREDGNADALADIIRQYRDGLIFYLNSIVGDLVRAEELAEDTFVLLGTKKPRDKGRGSFKTWLYTIGHNLAVDSLRRNKNDIPLDDCPELSDTDAELERGLIRDEQKIYVNHAMRKLKAEYRQVLWLFYFEDMSTRETAAIMGKSVHSTETLLYRARNALKNELISEEFEYEGL